MAIWRFDQGRLHYFQFDEIKKIAAALFLLDGTKKPGTKDPDTIRQVLAENTSLPFSSGTNKVWRNFGRVFEIQLLATVNKDIILVTDLCKKLASSENEMDSDDYFSHFSKNFYYSSPIFEDYSNTSKQVFPAVIIIKYLISNYLTSAKDFISINDIVQYLVFSQLTGQENLTEYSNLSKKNTPSNFDPRQLRELVIFLSQFSFLKWSAPNLYLEIKDKTELHKIEKSIAPTLQIRSKNRSDEILKMGGNISNDKTGIITLQYLESIDEEFTEGQKIRVMHLRSERSSKLKSIYFKKIQQPQICRMCDMDTLKKYPWTPHVIELHHLLPLASPIRFEKKTTSVKDLVGLCPSCHRATHKYYFNWFKVNKVKDFGSYEEANNVYEEAKNLVSKIS